MARLKGTNGDDTIVGTAGDDTIVPLLGKDTVDGGAGYDTLVVDYSSLADAFFSSSLYLQADGSCSGMLSGGGQGALNYVGFKNVEQVKYTATQGNDHLDVDLGQLGAAKAQLQLDGSGGDDTLAVLGGELIERLTLVTDANGKVKSNFAALTGWDNYDISLGLATNNKLVLGDGNDRVISTGGKDTIDGGDGRDFWVAYYQDRDDDLDVSISTATATITVDGSGGRLATVSNVEQLSIESGAGDDVVTASGGSGSLSAGGGSDELALNPFGAGASMRYDVSVVSETYLTGTATVDGTFDTLSFDNYESVILGGSDDADSFTFNAALYQVADAGFGVHMSGGAGEDSLALFLQAQGAVAVLKGGDDAGYVDGLGDLDVLTWTGIETVSVFGGAGDDLVDFDVASGFLAVDGGAGFDTIDFGAARSGVSLKMGSTAPTHVDGISVTITSVEGVIGSAFDDVLTGSTSANRLTGGLGADTLKGFGGADVFAYTSKLDSTDAAYDRIVDFSHAQGDRIDLSAVDAKDGFDDPPRTNDAFTWIGTDAFHGVSGELREVAARSGYFLYGDTNGDKAADLTIFVSTTTALVAGDIVL